MKMILENEAAYIFTTQITEIIKKSDHPICTSTKSRCSTIGNNWITKPQRFAFVPKKENPQMKMYLVTE